MNLRRSLSIYWISLRGWWADRPRFARYDDPKPLDPRMREILDTTLSAYSGKLVGNVMRNNALLNRLRDHKRST